MEITKAEILAEYYEKHAESLFRSAYAMVRNKFDAEVIVQDTFVTASEKFDDFMNSESPVGWLYLTMKNMAKRLLHERKRVKDHIPYDEDTKLADSTDHTNLFLEYRGIVPDEDLQMLINYHCDKCSCEELSAKHGKTLTNIRVKLFRSRSKFREQYRKELEKLK